MAKRIDELRAGLQAYLANAARSTYATVANRVYYEPFPQGATLPLLTIYRLPGSGYHRMGTRATPIEVEFVVSAWSVNSPTAGIAQADSLLSKVLDDLDGYRGLLGTVTVGMSKLMTINPEVYEPDAKLYRASADFRFSYDPEA